MTCENVTKSQNLACPDMREFSWPHQDSVGMTVAVKMTLNSYLYQTIKQIVPYQVTLIKLPVFERR